MMIKFFFPGGPAGIAFDGLDTTKTFPSGAATDAGNVSHVIPTAHPVFAIEASAWNHTREFTSATGSDAAQAPTLRVAKLLALTALDVLRDPELLQRIREDFKASRSTSAPAKTQ